MATKNRRVAAYLPPEIDRAFVEFKVRHGLATEDSPNQNDSQALIQLLSEFLGATHQVNPPVSHQPDIKLISRIELLETELVARMDELSSELLTLKHKVDAMGVVQDLSDTLTTSQMAERIGIKSSTLSHWKKDKAPRQLRDDIQVKDPEGIAWVYIPDVNRFKKESDIPSVLQGELLSDGAMSSAQVNPLPEGSERSGEG
jgi:hypothetical protein